MAMNIALSIMNSDEKNSPPASKDAADSVVEYLFTTVEKQKKLKMNDAISNIPDQKVGYFKDANDAVNLSRYRYTLVLIIVHESNFMIKMLIDFCHVYLLCVKL